MKSKWIKSKVELGEIKVFLTNVPGKEWLYTTLCLKDVEVKIKEEDLDNPNKVWIKNKKS